MGNRISAIVKLIDLNWIFAQSNGHWQKFELGAGKVNISFIFGCCYAHQVDLEMKTTISFSSELFLLVVSIEHSASVYHDFSSFGQFHQDRQLVLSAEQVSVGDSNLDGLAWFDAASLGTHGKQLVVLDLHFFKFLEIVFASLSPVFKLQEQVLWIQNGPSKSQTMRTSHGLFGKSDNLNLVQESYHSFGTRPVFSMNKTISVSSLLTGAALKFISIIGFVLRFAERLLTSCRVAIEYMSSSGLGSQLMDELSLQ